MRTVTPTELAKLKSFGTTVSVVLSLRDDTYTKVGGEWVNNNELEDVGVALMFKKDISADFLRSNAQKVEMEIKGAYDLVGKEIVAEFGLEWIASGGTTESATVPLGVFIPKEWEINAETGNTVVKEGYDRLPSLQEEYSEGFSNSLTFPITVEDLLIALADYKKMNIEISDSGNLEKELDYDIYLGIEGYTYRAVLDDILQGCGLSGRIRDNTLMVYNPVNDSDVLDLIETDFSELKVRGVQEEFNVLNLAREPQHDNYFYPLELPEDKVEMVIENNLLSDIRAGASARAEYAPAIFDEISQIGYRMFESKTWGFPQIEPLDRVSITGIDGVDDFESYIMRSTLTWDGSLTQTMDAVETQYLKDKYVLVTDRERSSIRTEIKVDKQAGEIELLSNKVDTKATIYRQPSEPENPEEDDLWLNTTNNVIYRWAEIDGAFGWRATSISVEDISGYYTKNETDAKINIAADRIEQSVGELQEIVNGNTGDIVDVSGRTSVLEQTVEGLDISIKGIGGSNLFENSVGLKGSYQEWVVDEEDDDNDCVIVQDNDVVTNTDSRSGFRLEGRYIEQSVDTIVGDYYTLFFRFKRNGVAKVIINDIEENITVDGFSADTWYIWKKSFVSTSNTVKIRFSNVGATLGSYILLSDITIKAGGCDRWVQAPNESYGKNFRMDKDGFSITAEDSNLESTLDERKFSVREISTNKEMIYADKDKSLLTNLNVQDEMGIQRYGDESSMTRIIPLEDGAMLVVND